MSFWLDGLSVVNGLLSSMIFGFLMIVCSSESFFFMFVENFLIRLFLCLLSFIWVRSVLVLIFVVFCR